MSCSNQSKETNEANDSASVVEVSEIIEVPESSDETEYSEATTENYDGAPSEEYVAPTYNAPAQPTDENSVHSLDEYDGN